MCIHPRHPPTDHFCLCLCLCLCLYLIVCGSLSLCGSFSFSQIPNNRSLVFSACAVSNDKLRAAKCRVVPGQIPTTTRAEFNVAGRAGVWVYVGFHDETKKKKKQKKTEALIFYRNPRNVVYIFNACSMC